MAVEGLQDQAKDTQREARATEQPGEARDRPGRYSGAVVAAYSCCHATLPISAPSGAIHLGVLGSGGWVTRAHLVTVSASLRALSQLVGYFFAAAPTGLGRVWGMEQGITRDNCNAYVQNVRRGHNELTVEVPAGQRLTVAFDGLVLAI
jgi:hypothetical protein